MTCNVCGEKPKKTCNDFTKDVIEINNPETLVLLRKVVVPASMGTEEQIPAAIGKYHNVILYYEANKHVYIYSSDGIPTFIEMDIPQSLTDEIASLEESIDEVGQRGSYSTSEKDTGSTWIDGSTIYKKTINFGALPDNATKGVATGIPESVISKIIKIEGYAYSPTFGLFIELGGEGISLHSTKTEVEVRTYNTFHHFSECYITIYYTKN